MEAILLGSAGNDPVIIENNNTIAIPTILPSAPLVLTELPFFEGEPQENYETSNIFPDNITIFRDGENRVSSVVRDSKTVIITRDAFGIITSISDGIYQRDINRINGLIVSITITRL